MNGSLLIQKLFYVFFWYFAKKHVFKKNFAVTA